jgi:hypothetical protein
VLAPPRASVIDGSALVMMVPSIDEHNAVKERDAMIDQKRKECFPGVSEVSVCLSHYPVVNCCCPMEANPPRHWHSSWRPIMSKSRM